MKNRTVLIVLGIAVLLLAFILLFERETMTTDELEGRRDRVFVEFRRDAVERLAILGTSGTRVELERVAGAGEDPDTWKIVSPRELAADDSAVRGALSAIDFLLRDRTVEGEQLAADPIYGLAEPRVTASFTIRGRAFGFRIGADSKDGQKVYLALDESPGEFYAVERDFLGAMDLGLDDLRDKHLVTGSLGDAVALRVQREGHELDLSREPGAQWTVARNGERVAAAEDQVAELLSALGNLRAESFAADGVSEQDLARYGLDAPSRTVTARRPDDGGELRLLLGRSCEGEHRIHATAAGTGTVACVGDGLLSLLDRPVERMCEMRAAVFRDDDVTKIAIEREGRRLVLERDDDLARWQLADEGAPAVEQRAVADLLEALRTARAQELATGDEALAALGEPTATAVLELDAGQDPIELRVWEGASLGEQLLRRGEEQAVLKIGGGLLDLIAADPLAFRKRTIAHGERDDVVSLAIRGPVTQLLEREGASWKLVEPIRIAADGPSARELAGMLAVVKATRYAAPSAKPVHGLAEPWVVVTARFVEEKQTEDGKDRTGEREIALEIGAVADPGTRYARIRGQDGPVLVLGQDYLDAVGRPLAARDLLQIDGTELVKIELRSGERSVVARREGNTWIAEKGSAGSTDIARIVADLGAVKAVRAADLGPPPSDAGKTLERPAEPIAVRAWTAEQLEAEDPLAITFGDRTDDDAENGCYAWRDGLEVTYVMPSRIADEIRRLITPEA